jgi:hypothetical protein
MIESKDQLNPEFGLPTAKVLLEMEKEKEKEGRVQL